MVTFVAPVDTAIQKSSESGDLQAGMWKLVWQGLHKPPCWKKLSNSCYC